MCPVLWQPDRLQCIFVMGHVGTVDLLVCVVPEDGTHYQLFCFHRLAYFVVHLMLALLLSLLTTLDEVMKGFILPRKMVEVS